MAKSEMPFDKFLLKFLKSQNESCTIPERIRTQMSVLLEKRYRGETLGDRIGRWNYKTQNYIEPAVDQQPFNIYTENIVKPKVRANAATMSQARIAIICDPRTPSSTRSKKNALISQKISDWVDDQLWTNDVTLQINEMKQLTHGVFLRSFWNEEKEGRPYDAEDWEDEDFDTPAEVACVKCGAPGYLEGQNDTDNESSEPDDKEMPTPPCSTCGGPTEILSPSNKTTIPKAVQTTETKPGDNDLEILPSIEWRVDERRSQGGKVEKCKWAARCHLMTAFEIETEFGIDDIGQPGDWPYQLKWLYTLQTGTSYPFKGYRTDQVNTIKEIAQYAVWRVYFTPEWLGSYTAGVDYSQDAKNDDNAKFEIKVGEVARDVVLKMADEEAAKRQSKVQKKGLCVVITADRVLSYYLCDFRKEIQYTYLVSDPYSFWGLCYSELETMQHLVNQTLTAIGNQVQSNQNIGVFNRDSYDDDDLSGEKNQIYTREGNDLPINQTFGVIPALPVTADTWNLFQSMKADAETTSLVSKEMQGQPTNVKTFGQAQLNRDMSVGILSPAQQSTANAKTGVCKQQCILAQMHWPKQRVAELVDVNEGIISEEDIETWFNSDLDSDVVFSYREGSEMPKSFLEKRDDLSYVTNYIAAMSAYIPGLMTPELGMDLINRVADYSTIDDLDIRNAEVDKEVAEIRYTIICKDLDQQLQHQLGVAQTAQQLQAQTLFAVLQNPILQPLKQENHIVAQEFYRNKCLAEYKKEQPNMLLIAALQEMIQRHNQAAIEQGQLLTATALAIQQPAMEAQAAMSQGQPNPRDKIIESIAFKDLPDSGKVQLAQQAGINISPDDMPPSDQEVKANTDAANLQVKGAQIVSDHQTRQQEIAAENARTQAEHLQTGHHKALDVLDSMAEREHETQMADQQHQNARQILKETPKTTTNARS